MVKLNMYIDTTHTHTHTHTHHTHTLYLLIKRMLYLIKKIYNYFSSSSILEYYYYFFLYVYKNINKYVYYDMYYNKCLNNIEIMILFTICNIYNYRI